MSEAKPEDSGKLYCDILTSKPESLSIDELFKGIVHFLIGRAKREDEYHNEERFFAFKDQLFNRVNVLRNTNADMFAALKEAREALRAIEFETDIERARIIAHDVMMKLERGAK